MINLKNLIFVLTLFSALGCGLMGGVFFAFSSFVMKGLAHLPASEGIAAMQAINVAAERSLFGATFVGTPIICLLTMILAVWHWHHPGISYIFIGGAVYLTGSLLATIAFNIPMNDLLASVTSFDSNSTRLWISFLDGWIIWNHLRAVASVAAAISFVISLFYQAQLR